MAGRFRYALAPLRQTRQWDLDDLLRAMGDVNGAIAAGEAALARLKKVLEAASHDWQVRCAVAMVSADEFVRFNRYAADLVQQARAAETQLEALAGQRESLMGQVEQAQRALEAVEDHHDQMHAKFMRERTIGEFKEADDQWNTRQGGDSEDDS